MELLRTKRISTGRLNEILGTINPRVVKTVLVEGHTNSYPPKFDWAEVTVGYTKYVIGLIDIDPRYANDEVDNFLAMLAKHDNWINFKMNDFKYYKQTEKCSGMNVIDMREEYDRIVKEKIG